MDRTESKLSNHFNLESRIESHKLDSLVSFSTKTQSTVSINKPEKVIIYFSLATIEETQVH